MGGSRSVGAVVVVFALTSNTKLLHDNFNGKLGGIQSVGAVAVLFALSWHGAGAELAITASAGLSSHQHSGACGASYRQAVLQHRISNINREFGVGGSVSGCGGGSLCAD